MFFSVPSCSMLNAYKEKCLKLKQAINLVKPVELLTNDNRTVQFKSVGIQSGKFFGIEDIKGRINKILLNINDIKMITLL